MLLHTDVPLTKRLPFPKGELSAKLTEPANKKSRGNEVKIGERRGEREEKKGYSKQIAAKASIKKSGSSTAC